VLYYYIVVAASKQLAVLMLSSSFFFSLLTPPPSLFSARTRPSARLLPSTTIHPLSEWVERAATPPACAHPVAWPPEPLARSCLCVPLARCARWLARYVENGYQSHSSLRLVSSPVQVQPGGGTYVRTCRNYILVVVVVHRDTSTDAYVS
jgi:hypothetical protein